MEKNLYEVTQLSTKCLAQFGYFIQSGKECAVIDPLRDTKNLDELIEKSGCTLSYIILTHFHADYIAGHFELKKKYGAKILIGPTEENLPSVNSNLFILIIIFFYINLT